MGTFQPGATGLYTLKIENTRTLTSSTLLYNYIDNIDLKPILTTFNLTSNCNVPCSSGAQKLFSISAGFANGGKDYWIWFTLSGTYPGFDWNGNYFPLNQDALFWWGLSNPGFAGSSGFFGTLSGSGSASATLTLPSDPGGSLVGFPIHFIYVLLSPGHQPPVLSVSNQVHLKYIP